MAIARRAAASAGVVGTVLTISKPTGTVDGDVMVAVIGARNNDTITCTPPAGWTEILSVARATSGRMFIYWKLAASEGASYDFTLPVSNAHDGGIVSYSGVDTTTPVDVSNSTPGGAGSSVNHDTPSVTTTVLNAMVVRAAYTGNSLGVTTYSWATSSEAFDVDQATGAVHVATSAADLAQPAAGASGVENATASNTGTHCQATVALKPAGAVGGTSRRRSLMGVGHG